jgi:hypothetical protein
VFFRNSGDGKFDKARELTERAMFRGLVAADLDAEGCLDLVVTALDEPARILRNPCTSKTKHAERQWLGSSAVGYSSSVWPVSPSSSR